MKPNSSHKLTFGDDDQEKLEDLLAKGFGWKGKLRVLIIGFTVSLTILALPLACVHTFAFRHRFTSNESLDFGTTLHGFPTRNGELKNMPECDLLHMAVLVFFKVYFYFEFPDATSAHSRMKRHCGDTLIGWMTAGALFPVASSFVSLFPNPTFLVVVIYEFCYYSLRISLLLCHCTLLTILQEAVPRSSRGFTTAVWCTSITSLNWFFYTMVPKVHSDGLMRFNDVDELRNALMSSHEALFVLLFGWAILYVLWRTYVESPYVYVNFSKRVIASRKSLESESFQWYWGIDIDNVHEDTKDEMREKCILPLCQLCDDNEEPKSKMFGRTFVLQLALCVIQLPAFLVLANCNLIHRQLGCSSAQASALTDEIYAVFVISTVLTLFVADRYSQKGVVLCAGIASVIMLTFMGVLYIDNERATLILWRITMMVFVLVNGVFLIPTTWTVIGDVCGKHRPRILVFVLIANALMAKGGQTVFELGGLSGFLTTVLPINLLALATFAKIYQKNWSCENTMKSISYIRL